MELHSITKETLEKLRKSMEKDKQEFDEYEKKIHLIYGYPN